MYSKHKRISSQPSNFELCATILDVISSKAHVYIVIDGLDEIFAPAEVAKSMLELQVQGRDKLHIMFSSRLNKEIKDELISPSIGRIELSANLVVEDIERYVTHTLANDKSLNKWPPKTREKILKTLVEKSDGMFQWVYCQLEELRKCVSMSKVKSTLSTLPRSLDETYQRMLSQIEERGYTDYAVRILQLLFFSFRTMRLKEVIDFLAIQLDDDAHFCEEERLPDQEDILQLCSGLITTTDDLESFIKGGKYDNQEDFERAIEKGPEVRISHISVAEYILSNRCPLLLHLSRQKSETVITHCCLVYLLHICNSTAKRTDLLQQYPLSTYAARFWFEHLNGLNQEHLPDIIMANAAQLIQDHPAGLRTWRRIMDLDHCFDRPIPFMISRIYRTTGQELQNSTEKLNEKIGEDIRGNDYRYQPGSALYYACLTGNQQLVERMLLTGSDLNTFQGGRLGYAVTAAATSNQDLAAFLISRGAHTEHIHEGFWDLVKMDRFVRPRVSPYLWC